MGEMMARGAGLVMAALALAAAPMAAAPGAPDEAEGPWLAIAPPWRDVAEVTRAAGGWPVGPFSAPFGVLVTGDGPDFPARLRAAGAWAVRDGAAIARICGAAT